MMKFIATRSERLRDKPYIVRYTKVVEDIHRGTIVIDLPGPMVKFSGRISKGRISLDILPKKVLDVIEPGDLIVIGDDLCEIIVRNGYGEALNDCECKDEQVHVIGKDIDLEFPTDKDLIMAEFADSVGAHAALISMVRNRKDILKAREILPKDLLVIAKIETNGALKNITDILEVADGVIIARGDLALNAHPEKMFSYMLEIAMKAAEHKKPVFAGTGFLKSLVHRGIPERSELDDVALAYFIGIDAILFTKETTATDPRKAIERFKRIITANADKAAYLRPNKSDEVPDVVTSYREALDASQRRAKKIIRFEGDEFEARKAALLRGVFPNDRRE